ncbi:ornithine cyclodeaminase family protein [Actinomadura sp. SCN-SB]|uniref:ornithine cyclodeaminase family protein n=1 Tax=Actinomadura sp. SCN-SB TaxID=3373092 RepID=UPI0037513E09
MTLHLDSQVIRRLCTPQLAFDAAHQALADQREGRYQLPPRLDVNVPTGFFRAMPAALGEYMGAKLMTLAKGVGNRYLLLLYRQDTGELVATLDAAEVTKLRTAATTAVAGDLLCPEGTSVLGLVGSGFEAEGHLRAFAALWSLEKVTVFSRSPERREAFAARLGADLGIEIEPVGDVAEVAAASPVTVLCTKDTSPVVDGGSFAPGAVVLSIGSTRPDLRELDEATFARAKAVMVDDPRQVLAESGDVAAAIAGEAITADFLVGMAEWDAGGAVCDDSRDLYVFKSVGTALQDLALGAVLFAHAKEHGLGREIGDITELKSAAPAGPSTKEGAR